jgi:hypothetical protein
MGSLVAVSLAARDWFLFLVVASVFAIAELAPTRAPGAAAS